MLHLVSLINYLCLFVSFSIFGSPIHSPITASSLFESPLCLSIIPSVFHSWLKTYLFPNAPPVVLLLLQTATQTVPSELLSFCYPHMLTGKVWIYRLLFVCLCVSTVTDFSAEDKASGVKFCTVVHRHPRQGISHFGELGSP